MRRKKSWQVGQITNGAGTGDIVRLVGGRQGKAGIDQVGVAAAEGKRV
jgi:hypothetical protein